MLHLEKRRSADSNEIIAKLKDLYKRRSSESETNCLDYLKNINIDKLSTEDMNSVEVDCLNKSVVVHCNHLQIIKVLIIMAYQKVLCLLF